MSPEPNPDPTPTRVTAEPAARGGAARLAVSARSLRRGAPVGFLPRAIGASVALHATALACLVGWGDLLAGGPPRDVRTAVLQVARAERPLEPRPSDEPDWTIVTDASVEVPDLREEPEALEELPSEELEPAPLPRSFERLPLAPLQPFDRGAAAPPAPVEVEPELELDVPEDDTRPPSEPLEETLVVGVPDSEPVLVDGPPPVYPPLAQRRGWEGTAVVRIVVSAGGGVLDATIAESSGHRLLDEAALEAIRAWRFTPATRGGLASETTILHRVRFDLVD